LRRLGYRGAWWGLRAWWLVRRPHTAGVKLVARDSERVLFVRHAYGDRRGWELPGGGVRRREAPADAARREAREELGVDSPGWRPLTVLEIRGMGKRTTLHVFEAPVAGATVHLQLAELAEGRWAPLDEPPEPLGRDAVALLEALGRLRG
jgi:8-oxo-dGTP pyrophosphatase MutT (NUDIX family)